MNLGDDADRSRSVRTGDGVGEFGRSGRLDADRILTRGMDTCRQMLIDTSVYEEARFDRGTEELLGLSVCLHGRQRFRVGYGRFYEGRAKEKKGSEATAAAE